MSEKSLSGLSQSELWDYLTTYSRGVEMSEIVLAKDAKAGQWYMNNSGARFLCCDGRRLWTPEGETWNAYYDLELTHLPDCTGWDWQPPKPEKKYRPFANAAEFAPNRDRWISRLHVANKKAAGAYRPVGYDDLGIWGDSGRESFKEMLEEGRTFADDGTPFGVEVTE